MVPTSVLDQQGGLIKPILKLSLTDNKKISIIFRMFWTLWNIFYTISSSQWVFNLKNAEAMMNFTKLKNWVSNQIAVNNRLRAVCIWYLIFLMISVRKHSLTAAASFSGLQTSQFSRLLKNHPNVAVYQLDQLSKKQARQFSSAIKFLSAGRLPLEMTT